MPTLAAAANQGQQQKSSNANPNEDFFERNKKLNRPMSPFMHVVATPYYGYTSMLSITHRGTGLGLSLLTSGFAIGKH